jgi:predicted metal-dependent phosphoesterase TrpH
MGFLDRVRDAGAPTTPAEADRLAVRQLEGRGADLTQPRHIIHVLYFPDETDARRAADEIERAGYETTVALPGEPVREWSVRAEANRVVAANTVEAFRAWFEQIATEFRGEYDGWEASAKP